MSDEEQQQATEQVEEQTEQEEQTTDDAPAEEQTEQTAEETQEAADDALAELIEFELAMYSYPDPNAFQSQPVFDAIRNQRPDQIATLAADTNWNIRDEDGSSYLHFAYKLRAETAMVKALLPHSDLSQRDENGDSVIDLALRNQESYGEAFMKTLEEYLGEMMLGGDTVRLESMVIGGMEVPRPSSAKRKDIRAACEDMDNLLDNLDGFESKISQIHSAVHSADLETVKTALEKKKLAKGRDVTGMIPLHKAVVFQHLELVQYLAENFPVLIDTTDHVGRTALHYAAVCENEQIYQILLENGASEDATDLKGKTPAEYKEDKTLIDLQVIQERVLEKTAEIRKTMRSRPNTAEREKNAASSKREEREVDSRQSHRSKSAVIPTYDPKRDPFLTEKAPPPKTPETSYVAENLGEPLTLALAEIVDKRPWDPIEFLAQWLRHYSKQSKYQEKMKAEQAKLDAEKEAAVTEEERQNKCKEEVQEMEEAEERKRKEEEERIRLEELEAKRKQESSLAPPDLPTVAEESEAEPETARLQPKPGLRDQNGQTELHRAALTEESNLAELLESGFDLTMRDVNGKTAYQLADEAGLQGNKDIIDAHVLKIFESGNIAQMTVLLLNGYENLPNLDDKLDELPEAVQAFWTGRAEMLESSSKARETIIQGDKEALVELLQNPVVAGRDLKGHSLLHEAVLNINKEGVELLLEKLACSVDDVDNYDRSALHYAAAIDGTMYTLLRASGADEALADIHGHMASYYIDNRTDIFSSVEGLEELVQVHIANLASEIIESADGIEQSIDKRVSQIEESELPETVDEEQDRAAAEEEVEAQEPEAEQEAEATEQAEQQDTQEGETQATEEAAQEAEEQEEEPTQEAE